jgi:hypothetical protein
MDPGCKRILVLALTAWFLCANSLRGASDRCAICNGPFGDTVYGVTDKVTGEKIQICRACATWPDVCFICGLPVRKDYLKLEDGRFLCARDAKTAVLDNEEAHRICDEVKDGLDRLFSRFLKFPDTNVDIAIVDRVSLLAFKVPGNDFDCPNVLGYIKSKTNHNRVTYAISLMSALPRSQFEATCAHEYTHAWVYANVPAARRKTLGHDAHEGFCELVAYLLMDSQHEEDEKRAILANAYTRGQINLFIEAEKCYGFNDIVDWIKYGIDAKLDKEDLGRIRNVQIPRPGPARTSTFVPYAAPSRPKSDTLVPRGVSLATNRPLAFLNDQALGVGESASIRVGNTNMLVRCLAIGESSIRIQIGDSGAVEELQINIADQQNLRPAWR